MTRPWFRARALAILMIVSALATGCAMRPLAANKTDTANASQADPSPASHAFEVDIRARDDVKAYLERHLDLLRYRTLADLDDTELERLSVAADTNTRDLLATLGHFSPKVTITRTQAVSDGRPVPVVQIAVQEGPATTVQSVTLSFEGDIAQRPAAAEQRLRILDGWTLPAGKTFTQEAWDDAKRQSLRLLSANRYPLGRITSSRAEIDPPQQSARLSVTLDSGAPFRWGSMQVHGLERYKPELVERIARLKPGSEYDQVALLEAQQRLQDSGYFNSVVLEIDAQGDPQVVPVIATVREAKRSNVQLGVGVSTDSGPRLSVEHTNHQMPLIGWRAVSKVQLDRDTQAVQSQLTAPPDAELWQWQVFGQLKNEDAANVKVRSQQLRAGRLQLGEKIDRNYYLQYDRASTSGIGVNDTAQSVSANYAWTQRRFDSLPYPSDGYGLGVEIGGGYTLGSQRDPYLRSRLNWLGVWSLAPQADRQTRASAGRIALRVQAGAVFARDGARLPSTQLFLTGGDATVRGYRYNSIGAAQANGITTPGRYLAGASVEWQRPILVDGRPSEWEGTVFIDAGAVADKASALKAKVGIGAGVRYRSPVGPLQLDLAYGLDVHKLRLHLSVGFTFLMRKLAFALVWVVELVLVASAALLLAAWIWSGTEGSLATLLRQLQPYLPAGQTLVVTDVQGAIRNTGRIGSLHWQSNGLTIRASDLRFIWQPWDLLQRRIRVDQLTIAQLQVDDQRPASEPKPPPEVVLPLELDLPFVIVQVRLAGETPVVASDLAGHYRFRDNQHQLDVASVTVAQGSYSARLNLQARTPMTLDLQLQGTVTAPVSDGRSIMLDASGTLRGPLAGNNPHLDLLAQLQPAAGNTGALATARAMRASVSAQISPWATQPVIRAQSSFNHLDLAALWPAAPRTQLTGNAIVRPLGTAWLLDFNLINRAAGPWDKGQLPLDSAKGLVELATDQWDVQSLSAELGGGRIRLQGTLADPSKASATTGWEGQLQIQGVNPALLYSVAESVRLDGSLKARAAQQAVEFDVNLQPAAGQKNSSLLRGLHLRDAVAHGRWANGWLRLDTLRIRTAQATVDGKIDIEIASKMARGQLQLQAPGMQAKVSGQFGALDGNGTATLTATDVARGRAWVAQLPMVPAAAKEVDLHGSADLAIRWTGGWESLLHGRGAPLTLNARLQSARMEIRDTVQSAEPALRLRDLDLRLDGTLDVLQLELRGTASRASQQAQIVTSASGGRDGRNDWHATVRTLELQLQDQQLPGPWKLALAQPVRADYSPAALQLKVEAGKARLTGPQPGVAELAWEPVTVQGGATSVMRSKGALRGLPMGWMTLLARTDLTAAGLSGNLVFDGQWDITVAEQIVIRASLGRRSGDLRIYPDGFSGSDKPNSTATTVDAGIREVLLTVQADGERIAAQFRWDSERAGNAQASFATQLRRGPDGWSWPPDSPLEATIRARMPQVGVWSLLAPPGWRVRGTVDANLSLQGTRETPQWSGELLASEMAVRSVVDGIEFGNGQLRASLRGQRLNIEHFSLQGAGGAGGGELTASGFATWAPSAGAGQSPLQAIQLQIDAQAKALRVSARADRRLTVSGNLQAVLEQARLRFRGALTADQALFILPDETAPALGDDVIVLRRTKDPATNGTATTTRNSAAATRGKTSLQADLQVTLDLGKDFRVRGHGIDTRVAGVLALSSTLKPGESPTVTGALGTVGGQYRAYGQQLDIERGQMRFGGAYDNPSLDILAIRPKLVQRVGVQITGTALLPRVRLYAEPDLPEAEKLAWLVLGRSGANGGAEAAVLQQAALALLGGQDASGGIASRLGLDELSLSGAADTGSSGGAGSATVTLGKRISQNFYVAYEHSLAGTLGAFSIFYDLSERFTLRARTGEKSAVDLIFKYSYD